MSVTISPAVVVLPWPDSALLPNRSKGRRWSFNQTEKQAARLIAISEASGFNIGDVTVDHRVTIIFEPPDRRWRDTDGAFAALKPSLDGIAAALGIDDYHFNPFVLDRRDPVRGGRVTVKVDDDSNVRLRMR
jgi:crossover junction endodeoxyribonuclease RusA